MGDIKIPMTLLETLIGKKVWYRTKDSDFNSGVVTSIKGIDLIQIRPDGDFPCVTVDIPIDDVFQREHHLYAANYELFLEKVNKYCDSIRTVEDLVKFCYLHNMSDKIGKLDYPAAEAARKMAKKLLGIEVDEEAAALEREMEIYE